MKTSPVTADYARWLSGLKSEIQAARARAVLSVNQELIGLYHRIGRDILERQERQGWGAKVIDRLSTDLRDAFPDMKGLCGRNLKYMKAFAQACPELTIGQQPAAQLPWFHIVALLTKVSAPAEREWQAARAIEQAWFRSTRKAQIKSHLYLRQGAALNKLEQRLHVRPAQLAVEVQIKAPTTTRLSRDRLRLRLHRQAALYRSALANTVSEL